MRTRSTVVTILFFSVLGAACRGDEQPPTFSFSPISPPVTGPAVTSPAVTGPAGTGATGATGAPPTGSPGVTGAVNTGTASVSTTGVLTTQVAYTTLASPAIWAVPPGGMALNWTATRNQALGISGASFTAQQPTATERLLQFSVQGPDGLVLFQSSAGECLVTITPALANQMGGTFLCTNIQSEDGSITVNAQGSFSAAG
ncbi:MAG TPA: hypothetical protein VIX62_11710 [Actinomycetota bacterium]